MARIDRARPPDRARRCRRRSTCGARPTARLRRRRPPTRSGRARRGRSTAARACRRPRRGPAHALTDLGLRVVDVELIQIDGESHPHRRIDRCSSLRPSFGAEQVKCTSTVAGDEVNIEALAGAVRTRRRVPVWPIAFEFVAFSPVRTIADAVRITRAVSAPNLRLVVDATHLARSGGGPVQPRRVLELPPGSSAQVCDGGAAGATDRDGLDRRSPIPPAHPRQRATSRSWSCCVASHPTRRSRSRCPTTPTPRTLDESVIHARHCLDATRSLLATAHDPTGAAT